jgi:hypothetical protein
MGLEAVQKNADGSGSWASPFFFKSSTTAASRSYRSFAVLWSNFTSSRL